MPKLLALLLLALVLLAGDLSKENSGHAVKPNKWNSMTDEDWERVEKSLEAGDEEAELEPESEAILRQVNRKRAEGLLGETMMFLTMKGEQSQVQTDEFADYITRYALTGGIHIRCFRANPGKLIVTLREGWSGVSLYEMLVSHSSVAKVDWQDHPDPDLRSAVDNASFQAKDGASTTKARRRRRRRKRRRKSNKSDEKDEL